MREETLRKRKAFGVFVCLLLTESFVLYEVIQEVYTVTSVVLLVQVVKKERKSTL